MFPSSLPAVMQKMTEAEVERGLESARHRADDASARQERSRTRFTRLRTRKSGLRTESQVNVRPV